MRERLREEVRDIQQRVGITTLFVTHGQDEALALADRIVVMRDGKVEQVDPPEVVYRHPRTPFVAGFIGQMNLDRGRGARRPHAASPAWTCGADRRRHGDAGGAAGVPRVAAQRSAPGAPVAHRVIDYGTHLMVDIELAGGERLKAMTSPNEGWTAGMRLALLPREIAVYRDNVLVFRAAPAAGAAATQPAGPHG